jgi:hypothetical protein
MASHVGSSGTNIPSFGELPESNNGAPNAQPMEASASGYFAVNALQASAPSNPAANAAVPDSFLGTNKPSGDGPSGSNAGVCPSGPSNPSGSHPFAPETRPGTDPGLSRAKKRKLRDAAFEFVDHQKLPATYSDVDALGWRPRDLAGQIGPSRLQMLDSRVLVSEYRKDTHSVLETADGRVNWCLPNPEREGGNGHCAKILADRASAEALVNTMLDACYRSGGQFVNINFEILPPRISDKHRHQVAIWRDEAKARKTGADAGSASSTGGKQTAAVMFPKPEENPLRCANCKAPGHHARFCKVPSKNYGSARPCPIHNTKDHYFEECPAMASKNPRDPTVIDAVCQILIVGRSNGPQVRSSRWAWFDILAAGVQTGCLKTDPNTVFPWPWTNAFAKQVANAKPGDPVLQGKLHPKEWDPKKHRPSDLPEDPFVAGKSIADILRMRKNGLFDSDRFVPIDKQPLADEALAGTENKAKDKDPSGDIPMAGKPAPPTRCRR